MDLSVGLPVKKRETSEPKECEALNPKINKMMPAANKAKPTILFMPQTPTFPLSSLWGIRPNQTRPQGALGSHVSELCCSAAPRSNFGLAYLSAAQP
jgi:hypothetical protein